MTDTRSGGGGLGNDPETLSTVNAVYEQPWWLEAVAPGAWAAVEVTSDSSVVARLPYVLRRRAGLTTITMPPLTPTLGPWFAPIGGRYANRVGVVKDRLTGLIEALPRFDHLRMNLSPSLDSWLPFYWAGFQATVKYTYRIEDLSDLDRVYAGFNEHVRRGIRRAGAGLRVEYDLPIEELLRLDHLTYARQGHRPHVDHTVIRRLHAACAARGCTQILGAVDPQGRTHAALLIVWDEQATTALVNGRDPEVQSFGANTLLFWEAIQIAVRQSRLFDFEGSMIQPIEHFFRGFGGRLTPYFTVSKSNARARIALSARAAAALVRRS